MSVRIDWTSPSMKDEININIKKKGGNASALRLREKPC
jgi:hypothetical protein